MKPKNKGSSFLIQVPNQFQGRLNGKFMESLASILSNIRFSPFSSILGLRCKMGLEKGYADPFKTTISPVSTCSTKRSSLKMFSLHFPFDMPFYWPLGQVTTKCRVHNRYTTFEVDCYRHEIGGTWCCLISLAKAEK